MSNSVKTFDTDFKMKRTKKSSSNATIGGSPIKITKNGNAETTYVSRKSSSKIDKNIGKQLPINQVEYTNYQPKKHNTLESDKRKPVQSFSVKVLNWDEHTVKTEWLISKDEGRYQVRYFPIEVFENKEHLLAHGQFLKAFLYVSSGQMTIEFVDGTDLVQKSDFPDDYMLTKEDFSLFKFK